MNQMNKSNVTLWKNRDTSQGISQNQPKKKEDSKQVENEFIENLKKQIYFMEMELKLMKERENEIAKSGGFTQLFNDERDPSQHIQQLKTKYANMRKKMEDQIATLNDKKREVTGLNVALKAKLETLQKLERDVYMKLQNSQEKGNNKLNNLTSNYLEKNNERNELEANNRLQNTQLGSEIKRNEELEYNILSGEKNDELDKIEFESQIKLLEDMTTEKTKSYDETNNKIKELNTKTNEEPYFKQNVVNERKKYVDLNVELRHEIDSKNQLNEIRIQKKVKEANSEEIQNLNNHLNETNEKIKDLEDKIQKELEKIKNFNNDIIKNNIELKHKEEKKDELMETIDKRIKESTELKEKAEELNRNNEELKQKIGKEQTDNELIRNRNKLLAEEYSALQSKYDFITANYDYTTNLKKIKVDDLKNLTQTNNLVNSTIDTFVDKIGSFKKANIQNLMSIDDE